MAFRSILDIITGLGLSTGLTICGDFGDGSSYPGSGDTVSDRSGNGNDLKRGTTAGVDSADPTFNGSAGGLSSSEYASFDGGDTLTIVGSNPLQSFHKDNAKITILAAVYPGSTANNIIIGDNVFSTQIGFRFQITNAQRLAWAAGNGSTQSNIFIGTVSTIANTAWSIVGMSLDEAVGANGAFYFANGVVELFNSTFTSPSASNAAGVLCISGSEGATTAGRLANGSRIAWIAVWVGVALTQAQMRAIYYEAGMRMGIVAELTAALDGQGALAAAITGQATLSATLSGEGTLTCELEGGEEEETGPLIGPVLLSGAALSSLPLSSVGYLPPEPSADPTPFELAIAAAEVNLITLVKLDLTSPGSS